jgi:hypothetical protein
LKVSAWGHMVMLLILFNNEKIRDIYRAAYLVFGDFVQIPYFAVR